MPRRKGHKNIVILGATSDMALGFINKVINAWQKCTFHLLARNTEILEDIKNRGEAAGHHIYLYTYDLLHPPTLDFASIEYCIVYAGWLPPNNEEPEKSMLVNSTAIQTFTDRIITTNRNSLEHIIITGSIAGVRVRSSNKAYGLAKASLHAYVNALHIKYEPTVTCTLVIPGYVKTKMLAGHSTPAFLTVSIETMANKYIKWLEAKPKTAWSQPAWRMIGFILKLMPEFLIKKM